MANESWLSDILGLKEVQDGGAPMPTRGKVNFIGDVTLVDNPSNGRTDVTVGISSGLAQQYKAACRVASTANIVSLNGLLTIDGVGLSANDRVLVKNQGDQTTNGIYLAKTTAWVRAADFDATADLATGMLIPVSEGSTQLDTLWMLTTNAPLTLGSSNLVFQDETGNAVSLRGVSLQNASVGSPSSGYLIVYNGSLYIARKLINGDVDAAAAIAVSKLANGTSGHFLKATPTPAYAEILHSDIGDTVISDSIAADKDDYAPTGWSSCTVLRLDTNTAHKITGFSASVSTYRKRILNVDAGAADTITLQHDNGSDSVAANRILCPNDTDVVLDENSGVDLFYDGTSARWRVVST